jgi:predicted small lipoprotein YifL
MKRPAAILVLGLAVFAGAACGKKGPLEPPLAREPKPVERLTTFQRGGSVILEWTNPVKSIDGRPLGPLAAVEIWVLEVERWAGKEVPRPQDFEAKARLGRRVPAKDLRPASQASSQKSSDVMFAYPISGAKPVFPAMAFAIRVLDGRKRPSKFSAPVVVETRTCPLAPEIRDIRVFKDRTEVSWTPPKANIDGSSPAEVAGYNVYRSEGAGRLEKLGSSPPTGLVFKDSRFSFDVPYTYVVRARAAGPDPNLESDDSAPRDITAEDIFPPDPPSGLVALSGPGGISLSWEAGREDDVAGYKVWRKEEGGEPGFVPLTPELLPGNVFTDSSVHKGKTYVYAVSAVDKKGHESAKTESGLVGLKGNGA